MKRLITSIAIAISTLSFAQAPDLMTYQGVVWDTGGNLVASSNVGLQFSILQGSVSGTAVYVETHAATTNANGLVTAEIGNGTVVSGDISTIDWSNGPYFLQTETDPTGGTNYTITGTTQFLSVPYALYANVADSVANDAVDDADADPTNELNTSANLTGTDLNITDAGGTLTVDLSSLGGGTDDQTLTLTGTDLSIEDGNTVDLSGLQDGVNDADADPSNELQAISISGNIITLSNGGGSVTVPSSADNWGTQVVETDATLTGDGTTGNALSVNGDLTDDQTLTLSGTDLSISDGNTVDLSGLQDGVNDADADPSNEIQTISRTGLTVTLDNGGGSYTDSVNTYTAGTGIDITNNVISITSASHYVGELFGGGVVFYVDESGQHGLIVSLEDLSTAASAGSFGAFSTSFWDGAFNTSTAYTSSAAGSGVVLCGDYAAGGFTDWYLPAIDEIYKLASNIYRVNKTLDTDGDPLTTVIEDQYYHTSTKRTGGHYYYSFRHMSSYHYNNMGSSGSSYRIRAVRAF